MTAPAAERTLATFRYRALDAAGTLTTGELVSGDERDAVARIRRLGLRPVEVAPARVGLLEREWSIPGIGNRVGADDLAVMARQLATMVGAGVPLLRCLRVLADQTDHPVLATSLDKVATDVESGDSLSVAVRRHPTVFDPLTCALLRAGETAGALDLVLAQLADGLERTAATRRRIRSALTYPIAVLVMVAAIVTVMLLFVVPVFSGIYEDLGSELPAPTRALVALSTVLTTRLPIALFSIAVVVIGLRRWFATPQGRLQRDRLLLRLPLVGPLLTKSAMARFGRVMAVLTRSGVPVLETLSVAGDNAGNAAVTEAVAEVRRNVGRGETLAENLERMPIFPPMVGQLVAVGEETGALDDMLDVVGGTFEDEVETAVDGFSSLIEPLLMAVIGLTVGGMVVALYLPMFDIIDLVQ